ncbi:hypothetical protein ABZ079_30880 [Streptomyces sp. NPDC006314]
MRHVDVFGAYGVPLGVKARYTTLPDIPYGVLELPLQFALDDTAVQVT